MSDNYPDNFFVGFNRYCAICKYKESGEAEYPCDACLETPVRESTEVPEYYESAKVK